MGGGGVYAARPYISPNPGFLLQLRSWERSGMDFGAWKGWSRERYLEALEECGGAQACCFELVMADSGVSLAALATGPRLPQACGPEPAPPAAVKRRPMPVKLQHRNCCIS
ncbi:hypothetical protein TSOC_010060 [Tetrabaena socialis]|uniref:Uncharacterized protein n=1 Tax=Tetrabaena socialis TaxID=47790 RepID=A0A2J7ZUA4_9CHLO|nr:hypothetical protein TSOC_010060 [Tetrabaena socialis]|eukprot:PNH03844.1 hypothetical protein TSOC_010060 [Tetrabaena socialis]